MRFFLIASFLCFSGNLLAQTTPQADSASDSVSIEARARDEAYANWKVRYADNRAEVGSEIKAVRQEITGLDSTRSGLKQQLNDLLNGSVRNWNILKTDYADPQQYADCMALFATIREAVQTGELKL